MSDSLKILSTMRQGGARVLTLPQEPVSEAEAYQLQDAIVTQFGPLVAWKVGARGPESEPFRGAVGAPTFRFSPARMASTNFHFIGAEAELVYRFDRALPPRNEPYSVEEVAACIGAVHVGIEIVDTRFEKWAGASWHSQIADQLNHGALVVGTEVLDWQRIVPLQQPVKLLVNGICLCDRVGGNSAGDPMRMLVWMANVGAVSLGGIKEGAFITTGSCTGTDFVSPGDRIEAQFPGLGNAVLELF